MAIEPAEGPLDAAIRNIIADANERVGWEKYAAHIRKGGADDLASRVAKDIAHQAYNLGRDAARPNQK
jgi:hypothetical protein